MVSNKSSRFFDDSMELPPYSLSPAGIHYDRCLWHCGQLQRSFSAIRGRRSRRKHSPGSGVCDKDAALSWSENGSPSATEKLTSGFVGLLIRTRSQICPLCSCHSMQPSQSFTQVPTAFASWYIFARTSQERVVRPERRFFHPYVVVSYTSGLSDRVVLYPLANLPTSCCEITSRQYPWTQEVVMAEGYVAYMISFVVASA